MRILKSFVSVRLARLIFVSFFLICTLNQLPELMAQNALSQAARNFLDKELPTLRARDNLNERSSHPFDFHDLPYYSAEVIAAHSVEGLLADQGKRECIGWLRTIVKDDALPEDLLSNAVALKKVPTPKRTSDGDDSADVGFVKFTQHGTTFLVAENGRTLTLLIENPQFPLKNLSAQEIFKKIATDLLNLPGGQNGVALFQTLQNENFILSKIFIGDDVPSKAEGDDKRPWWREKFRYWWQFMEMFTDGKFIALKFFEQNGVPNVTPVPQFNFHRFQFAPGTVVQSPMTHQHSRVPLDHVPKLKR